MDVPSFETRAESLQLQLKLKDELCSTIRMIAGRQATTVLFDDAVADGQAKSGSLPNGLGREEGFKDAQQVLRQDAGAVVAQAHAHLSLVALDRQPELGAGVTRS